LWTVTGVHAVFALIFLCYCVIGFVSLDINVIESGLPFLFFIFFARYHSLVCKEKYKNTLLLTIFVYTIVGFLEYNYTFYSYKSFFFGETSFPGNYRGGSSLATEPSYFALTTGFCAFLYIILNEYKISFLEATYLIFALLLSKSLMALLFLPTILLCMKRNYLLVLLIPVILYILSNVQLGRIEHVYRLIQARGLFYFLLEDVSANARIIFSLKDVLLSYEFLFLPLGIGSYYFAQNIAGIPAFIYENMKSSYSLTLSGSYLGHFIVEFGLIIVAFVLLISLLIVGQTSNGFKKSLMLVNIMIISTQMISFTFFLLPAAVSLLIGNRRYV
jgi:hypothetical protein